MYKRAMAVGMAVVLSWCVTAWGQTAGPGQVESKAVAPAPGLSLRDIAIILKTADDSLRAQGCEPVFLNEDRAYIWARCQDGEYKLVQLGELIKQVREAKAGAGAKAEGVESRPKAEGVESKPKP